MDRFSHLLTRHAKGRVDVGVGVLGGVGANDDDVSDDVNDGLDGDGDGDGGGRWEDWRDPATLTRLIEHLEPVGSDSRPAAGI